MEQLRKPFQGVLNIIRFNWPYYIISLGFIFLLLLISIFIENDYYLIPVLIAFIIFTPTIISLLVSLYIYDISNLYQLNWLQDSPIQENKKIVNINAGFDETSLLLQEKFGKAEFNIFDFYDPSKHTEASIKRARKALPSISGTQKIKTSWIPLNNESVDNAFAIFSAHEVRDEQERVVLFKELSRIIKANGQIIVTEHLRDLSNFLAYNIGFLHFYSRANWHTTFEKAGLIIKKEIKITPFISTFILEKNGIAS